MLRIIDYYTEKKALMYVKNLTKNILEKNKNGHFKNVQNDSMVNKFLKIFYTFYSFRQHCRGEFSKCKKCSLHRLFCLSEKDLGIGNGNEML